MGKQLYTWAKNMSQTPESNVDVQNNLRQAVETSTSMEMKVGGASVSAEQCLVLASLLYFVAKSKDISPPPKGCSLAVQLLHNLNKKMRTSSVREGYEYL